MADAAEPAELNMATSSSSQPAAPSVPPAAASTIPPAAAPSAPTQAPVKHLILDAGPLLSLAPLRGLAQVIHTTPGVLAELRDPRARQHWERLSGGIDGEGGVDVREPDALSMAKVSAFAKATGDYAVLSKTDLGVLALTFMLEVEQNGYARVRDEYGKPPKGTKAGKAGRARNEKAQEEIASTASADAGPSNPSPQPARPPPTNAWNIPSPHVLGGANGTTADATEDAPDDSGDEDEVDEMDEDEYPSLGGEVFRAHANMGEGLEDEPGQDEERRTWSGPSRAVRADKPSPVDGAADQLQQTTLDEPTAAARPEPPSEPLYREEEPSARASDEDSDDGEWITPANVAQHKSLDLGLVPAAADGGASASSSGAGKKKKRKGKNGPPAPPPQMKAACMTGDYAVQNVLLQMGLNLVGEQGKRIGMVKSWVLRCHACFKICKDQSKKFCPSCGNPTLIRASVSTQAADGSAGPASGEAVQVHLKPNFQYRTRGTVYSIPQPKMGAAKGQNAGGSGLILREDQKEFMSAVRREEGRRAKEERALARAVKNEAEGKGHLGGWNDPDWLPEMLVVGLSGKGRRGDEQLPDIGYGRRNPNQVRRKKK